VTKSNGVATVSATGGGGSGTVTGTGVAGRAAFWRSTSAISSDANFAWDSTNIRLNIGNPSSSGTLNIKGSSATATQNTSITNSSNLAIFSALNDQTVGIGTSAPSNTLTVRATTATINTELPGFTHNYINTVYSRANSNASLAPYSSAVGGMIFTGIAKTNTPSLLFLGATNDIATATMAPMVFCGLRRNSANNNTTSVANGELCVSFYNGASGFDIGTRLQSIFGDGSVLLSSGTSASAKLHIVGNSNTSTTYSFIATNSGGSTTTPAICAQNDQKVGIGTNSVDSGATLEVDGTTGGILFPRLTTTQRDALTAVNGLVIYNSTTNKLQVYAGGAWVDLH
jgi:hypothetical protein